VCGHYDKKKNTKDFVPQSIRVERSDEIFARLSIERPGKSSSSPEKPDEEEETNNITRQVIVGSPEI
jgi:hypothetical protein